MEAKRQLTSNFQILKEKKKNQPKEFVTSKNIFQKGKLNNNFHRQKQRIQYYLPECIVKDNLQVKKLSYKTYLHLRLFVKREKPRLK